MEIPILCLVFQSNNTISMCEQAWLVGCFTKTVVEQLNCVVRLHAFYPTKGKNKNISCTLSSVSVAMRAYRACVQSASSGGAGVQSHTCTLVLV